MDFFHHTLVQNAGVPHAWPVFCMAFDLTAAVIVGCILAFGQDFETNRPDGMGGMPGRWRHRNVQEPQ